MEPSNPRTGLLRILGAWEATAVAIGVAIGAGIFRTPGDVARLLPEPGALLAVWVAGGLLALLDALVLAELAAMRPQAGGHYVFLRDAWGPRVGFLYGWAAAFLTWPASIAAVAAAGDDFARRLGFDGRVAGTAIILLPALIHLTGLRTGSLAQDLLSYVKAAGLALLAVAAIALAPDRAPGSAPGALALGGIGLALQRVLWTYDGYAEAVFVGEEVRDPQRNLPRALLRSIGILTVLYVAINAAFLACLSPTEMAASSLVAADAAGRVGGPVAVRVVEGLAMLTLLGGSSAMLLSGPRIAYAMARDGALFPAFARVSRGGTPTVALLAMAAMALLYHAFNTFDRVVEMTIFVIWCFVTLTTAALFVFRRREPQRERPFRVPFYPWLPGLLLVLSAVFLIDMLLHARASVLQGLVVLAIGAALQALWRGGRRGAATPGLIAALLIAPALSGCTPAAERLAPPPLRPATPPASATASAAPVVTLSPAESLPRTGEHPVEVRTLDTEAPGGPLILLALRDGSRLLPIRIGSAEALAIAVVLHEVETPRPMTHDLMNDLLTAAGARLLAVRVTDLSEGTFHARLELATGSGPAEVDARPSDAIALALRAQVPIFVSESVLAQAAIVRPPMPGAPSAALPGVTLQPLTPALAQGLGLRDSSGALVSEVDPQSAAKRAGLRAGDLIVAVQGKPVSSLEEFSTAAAQGERNLSLGIRRRGEVLTLMVARP